MSLNKKLKNYSPKINLKIDNINPSQIPIDKLNINDSHDLDTTCSTYN